MAAIGSILVARCAGISPATCVFNTVRAECLFNSRLALFGHPDAAQLRQALFGGHDAFGSQIQSAAQNLGR
jgi:hypothetical protein